MIKENGDEYKTHCLMSEFNKIPQSWTLIASFVNTDNTVSWGGGSFGNWTNDVIFGKAEEAEVRDFKGEGWFEVPATEIRVVDRFGDMSFYLGKDDISMSQLLNNTRSCTIKPIRGPRRNVRATNDKWAKFGVLMIYPELYPGKGCNVLNKSPEFFERVPVLGFGGTKCGLLGAGMRLSYSDEALDWHMSLNPTTTCTTSSCDQARCSGPWNGELLATSRDYLNTPGRHDDSEWGMIYVR